jgi:tRNA(Ile2) C34 agmatinyltransferase TiaS
MDRRLSAGVALAIVLLLAVVRAGAHHSFAADFDLTKPVNLTGRVTKIEWLNPHVHIFIDARDGTAWTIELGSPNGLRERGWTVKSLAVGDVISVVGSRAKDGSHLANASAIVLPSGARLSTGSGVGKTS